MKTDKIDLKSLLDEVDNNQLVLPDFQRDYVWIKDEDKITEFIASVLAQLPIGSIITFKNNANSFANKEIGYNKKVEFENPNKKIKYLLDGQQRLTTLSLVFSERIFNKYKFNPSEYPIKTLIQKNKINKRFFLRLPINDFGDFKDDLFGLKNLNFKYNPKSVSFCSNDVKNLIEIKSFDVKLEDDDKWYTPKKLYSGVNGKELLYLMETRNTGLIPLYLLIDDEPLLLNICSNIAEERYNILKNQYKMHNIAELRKYIEENNDDLNMDLSADDNNLITQFYFLMRKRKNTWQNDFYNYLKACIENLNINLFDIEDENTERAINMYEALNRGGVSLSTFDLVIAIAAKEASTGKSFVEKIKNILTEYKNDELLELVTTGLYGYDFNSWNSKTNFKTINSSNEINSAVIKQFLNLLCYVSNKADENKIITPVILKDESNEYTKAKKQLAMTSKKVVEFSELALKSLVDTFMILQFKCGVRSITDIDYKLIIFPLSYAMYLYNSDSLSNIKLEHLVDFIAGMYQYLIFSGEYSYDQSTRVINHLVLIHNWLLCNEKIEKFKEENLTETLNEILNIKKYNDLEALLLKNDVSCKNSVINSLLQFQLSKYGSDILPKTENKYYRELNAYDPSLELEVHHLTPLATSKSLGESTKEIRGSNSILNSPLNLVYISKEANRDISILEPSDYQQKISDLFLTTNCYSEELKSFYYKTNLDNEKFICYLRNRYNNLTQQIKRSIKDKLNYFIKNSN